MAGAAERGHGRGGLTVRIGTGSARPAPGRASHPYAGRVAALATMHGKEAAIAPPLSQRLGLRVCVPDGIDTDRLGTFSGEVERPGPIMETAIAKARLAMTAQRSSLGLASEGSFGPHPALPFIPGGTEVLVLVDDERGIVISEVQVDASNFASLSVAPGDDPERFMRRAGFPSHALVVRPNAGAMDCRMVEKGVVDRAGLRAAISRCADLSLDGRARIETDMRAHLNPTRMRSIGRLAIRFAARLATLCPACGCPGFGLVESVAGLPCGACGAPSIRVRHDVHACPSCSHREERKRAGTMTAADPRDCPRCNP